MYLKTICTNVAIAVSISLSMSVHAADQFPSVDKPSELSKDYLNAGAAQWIVKNLKNYYVIGDVPAKSPFFLDPSWKDYWGYLKAHNTEYQAYLTKSDNRSCNIPADHSNDATVERVITGNSASIYDTAVGQIALSIAYRDTPNTDKRNTYSRFLNSYMNLVAKNNPDPAKFGSYRTNAAAQYNGKVMDGWYHSYITKFMPTSWAGNFDTLNNCSMNWMEYSAITGEEAWAALIGPIQQANLTKGADNNWIWDTNISEIAIPALIPLEAMQEQNPDSPWSGGVYRNVQLAGTPQPSYDISTENMLSLYAGLGMLQKVLEMRLASPGKSVAYSSKRMATMVQDSEEALVRVKNMMSHMTTFFTNKSRLTESDGQVYLRSNGGLDNTFAVDVQTWGISVMEDYPDLYRAMKKAHGDDIVQKMWQSVMALSAYKNGSSLQGVGYGKQAADNSFYQMSGEWTLGAINAAIAIASDKDIPEDFRTQTLEQAKSMQAGINQLIATEYKDDTTSTKRIGYLYANKRALIPFGWYSNAMPSLASTGWAIFVNKCFDPFVLGGATETRKAVCSFI